MRRTHCAFKAGATNKCREALPFVYIDWLPFGKLSPSLSLSRSLARSLSRSLALSLSRSLARSLSCSLALSLSRSRSRPSRGLGHKAPLSSSLYSIKRNPGAVLSLFLFHTLFLSLSPPSLSLSSLFLALGDTPPTDQPSIEITGVFTSFLCISNVAHMSEGEMHQQQSTHVPRKTVHLAKPRLEQPKNIVPTRRRSSARHVVSVDFVVC